MLFLSLRMFLGVIVMLGLAATPSPAGAQNLMTHADVDFVTADASFTVPVAGDQTGCLVASYEVRVNADLSVTIKQGPGRPESFDFSSAGISIVEFNTCTSQVTKYHECSIVGSTGIDVSPNLAHATLDVTLPCFDPYDASVPTYEVTVYITWTATGPAERRFRNDRFTGFGEKRRLLLRAALRPAVATGSIVLDEVDLLAGYESDSAVIATESRATHILLNCKRNPDLCLPQE